MFLCRVSWIFKNIFHQNQRQLNNLQFHQHYHQLFSELEDDYLKTIFEHFNFKFIHFPFQVTVVQRKTQKMGERNLLSGRFSNHLYPASCSHHTTPVGTSYHYKETKEKKTELNKNKNLIIKQCLAILSTVVINSSVVNDNRSSPLFT